MFRGPAKSVVLRAIQTAQILWYINTNKSKSSTIDRANRGRLDSMPNIVLSIVMLPEIQWTCATQSPGGSWSLETIDSSVRSSIHTRKLTVTQHAIMMPAQGQLMHIIWSPRTLWQQWQHHMLLLIYFLFDGLATPSQPRLLLFY